MSGFTPEDYARDISLRVVNPKLPHHEVALQFVATLIEGATFGLIDGDEIEAAKDFELIPDHLRIFDDIDGP